MQRGFRVVMDIVTRIAGSRFAITADHSLQFGEQVGLGTEVTEMLVAPIRLLGHLGAHFGTVVSMERVSFDIGGDDILAADNLLESPLDGCRACARRTR